MNVLVTGGAGFLGTHLCRELRARGHTVVAPGSKTADLRAPRPLERFNDLRYDRIFHLAAWTQAGDFCLYHPGEQWIINQQINTNVLAWWHSDQPQAKLIAIGTSCAYDPQREAVEENYLAGVPTESLFTYAMTKRMLYAGLLALSKQFGLRYLQGVPSTIYGPGYHTDGRQMHFIFDLIRKILRGQRYGDPVVLWGDGRQVRELVYIDDFLRTMLALADTVENENVNIGSGEGLTIRHFAQTIADLVGYDFAKIQFDTTRYVGALYKCLGIRKLRALVPDYAPLPLEDGLKRTIAWCTEHMDRVADG